jgi:hypothetical protein
LNSNFDTYTEEELTKLRQTLLKFTEDYLKDNETNYQIQQAEYYKIRDAIIQVRRDIDKITSTDTAPNILFSLIRLQKTLKDLKKQSEIRLLKVQLKKLED